MTKPNPWHVEICRGPAFGGPLAGSDIEQILERKEIWVLGELVGVYIFDEDKWLWQPNDATPAAAGLK